MTKLEVALLAMLAVNVSVLLLQAQFTASAWRRWREAGRHRDEAEQLKNHLYRTLHCCYYRRLAEMSRDASPR